MLGGRGAIGDEAMEKFVVFMVRVVAALLAGALIGLERERARLRVSRVKALPGLRSFGLISLYGGVTGYLFSLDNRFHDVTLLASAGFMVLVLIYVVYRMIVLKTGGITTPVILMLSYALGFIAGLGFVTESLAAAAVATILLAIKTPVTRLVRRISYEELLAIFELALFYLALGPLVYALSSRISIAGVSLATIYTFFLIVLSLSFAGYVAWRLGTNPVLYAFFGGVVNSEATVALLARSAVSPAALEKLVPFVYLGMQGKAVILSIAALCLSSRCSLAASIAPLLVAPLAVNTVLAVLSAPPRTREGLLAPTAPLNYSLALKTLAVYAGLLILGSWLSGYLSNAPLLLLYSFLGGFVNATATILALSSLPLDPRLAGVAYTMLIAAATVSKVVYARMGSRAAARVVLRSALIYSISFILAAVAAWLQLERM